MSGKYVRSLKLGGEAHEFFSLEAAERDGLGPITKLPVSLKIIVENLLRNAADPEAVSGIVHKVGRSIGTSSFDLEVPYYPVRIIMPDSSGIPLLADLAAMREAVVERGGDPARIDSRIPLDCVVDHSVAVDVAGVIDADRKNLAIELERNEERYRFLRWAEQAFRQLNVVPPSNGICHQLNLERLASVVWQTKRDGKSLVCPETIVGMDSHTAMINSMGVLGWGVGGIEAAVAMLGEPLGIRIAEVIGCRLIGAKQPGVTTTDIVLTVTQRLRARGVIGAFVEFCGPGMESLALPERATLSNMCPEYGSSTALFPIDRETLGYLRLTGRPESLIRLVEAYAKEQFLWRDESTPEPIFTDVVEINLAEIEPSASGPRRPQDRIALGAVKESFLKNAEARTPSKPIGARRDGDVVIAAITSCTNTSNPSVIMAAGLLACNAVARGLTAKPWVKTSFAPGSRVVSDYLRTAGLQPALDALGFQVVGYGCTTCMGNSGPLSAEVSTDITANNLRVVAVLSGNRNFESRIHPLAKANYLVSPPLVVAYAIAGSILTDITKDPLGHDQNGKPVFLRELWPSEEEISAALDGHVTSDLYRERYAKDYSSADEWNSIPGSKDVLYPWNPESRFIRRPPYFDEFNLAQPPASDIVGARCLAMLGDSITTDHISPIGAIPVDGSAGRYLREQGVQPAKFGTYLTRRVNHDVMVRGTFANLLLRNEIVPDKVGGFTKHFPSGEEMTIDAAARRYAADNVPLVVIAGAEYGAGSSRDWAAKGTRLLGIEAVIAESFERIHRSNLVGMGVLPLQFRPGESRKTHGLTGTETYDILGLNSALQPRKTIQCVVLRQDGSTDKIELILRLDSETEIKWYRNGGVLEYAVRSVCTAA